MKLQSIFKQIIEELTPAEKKAMHRSKIHPDILKDLEKFSKTNPELIKVFEFFRDELQKRNLYGQISFGTDEMIIEPKTPPSGEYDGMQIIYFLRSKTFEVSEYQAGPNQDKLYVYTDTKQPKKALESLLLGNKNRKPIKVWD